MIRKLLLLTVIGMGLFACKDDDKVSFDVPVEFQQISFVPRPGGAVMHYKLPDDLDIFGVRVRYTNAYGEQLHKDGTYLTDTLLLDGFTEAQSSVPAQLSFFNSELVESEPIELTFATEASATVAVFDELTVNPFWGGFNVTYKAPETVAGTIHVFYIGTNPATQLPDSILMGSFPIIEGGDTLNFELAQNLDQLNVVVRTDDYDGHRVKMRIFEDVPSLMMDTLSPDEFEFSFTGNIQGEGEYVKGAEYGFGRQYLFDGLKKGEGFRSHFLYGERRVYDTFMAGPEAFGERFIFDLGSEKIPAALFGYAFLNFDTDYPLVPTIVFPGDQTDMYIAEIWSGSYPSRLPCKARVYGVKDGQNPETVDLSTCALLYSLDDSDYFEFWRTKSWCKDSDDNYGDGKNYEGATDAEMEAAEPIVLRMLCNYTGETFRYLVLVVDDTYLSNRWGNTHPNGYEENADGYITFDEIEVAVRAE